MNARDLLDLPVRELVRLMKTGHSIEPSALDDTEYRGVSLGLPSFIEKISWKTFKKVFHRDPRTNGLRGWNVRIEQTGLDAPFAPKTKNGAPITFGHYAVVPLENQRLPYEMPHGLLIDYTVGGNGLFEPLRRLKDPIVALTPGSADLLLGFSFVDVLGSPWKTPAFFSLERDVALTHTAYPPRPAES